jgi:hypothetical protein
MLSNDKGKPGRQATLGRLARRLQIVSEMLCEAEYLEVVATKT